VFCSRINVNVDLSLILCPYLSKLTKAVYSLTRFIFRCIIIMTNLSHRKYGENPQAYLLMKEQ